MSSGDRVVADDVVMYNAVIAFLTLEKVILYLLLQMLNALH